MESRHGGDIYRNQVRMDFSVNVNPLGMPEAVERALHAAAGAAVSYPDIAAERLKREVSRMLAVPEELLLFGNGASELFLAIVHAIRPQRTGIPVPSFYGYEYAAGAAGGEIVYYAMTEETGFLPGDDFMDWLTEDMELLFFANPNNPTGRLLAPEYLWELLEHCRRKQIYVVLDECFIDFCGRDASVLPKLLQYENLLLVRAFTKVFSIPGVRLGYLLCSNETLRSRIARQLPEWNLSVFAQAAGCACAGQTAFLERTVEYVRRERAFLEEGLKKTGVRVISGEADFLFLYSQLPLARLLLKQGILLRDCANFRGLSEGYYRAAVRTREENEVLIKQIGELNWTR